MIISLHISLKNSGFTWGAHLLRLTKLTNKQFAVHAIISVSAKLVGGTEINFII